MKHDLPSPDQMLEELADKAAAQINKLAPVAFDAALNELTRYHRFLLSVYASETPEGAPFNYAEVGGFFGSPHEEWIGQYRRLFEAAADRLADNPDFVGKLAHIPIRLLPRAGDAKLSPGVLRRIVDLVPILVHRLEAWVTRRTTIDNAPNAPASPRLVLAGSDRKAYESVVIKFVGVWESLLQLGPSLYGWREERRGSEMERWAAFAASWPFLWRHLCNTAYLLAVAVWNEDETGTVLYRDALVRWPASFSHSIARAELLQRRLLFPDILISNWDQAAARVKPLLPEYMPPPSPDELFSTALGGAHDDVILMTAALMLFWFMTEKQVSDVGARTAGALLRREPAHPEDRANAPMGQRSFRSLFLDILRLELAGERFRDNSYGGQLDEVLSSLDAMSERRVVPGRVYAPSTLNDRDGLMLPMLAILLAAAPADGDDGLGPRIDGLARDEAALPEGDRSLRNVLHYLRSLSTALTTPQPELRRAVLGLKPDKDFEGSVTALRTIIDDGITAIEAQRLERLKQRPLDLAKLERMRVAIEGALLTAPAEISFFRDFEISGRPHTVGVAGLDDYTLTINGVGKGELVDPPMEPESSNFIEILSEMACRAAANRVWGLFTRRPRERITVAVRAEEEAFWRTIAEAVQQVGPEPVLVVSREDGSHLTRRFLYAAQADKPNLKIERKPRADMGAFYIATVEGVDVYSADFEPGTAWLFSGRALHAVTYAALNAKNHRVDLAFDPGQVIKGALRIRFIQSAVWADYPIFDIRLDNPNEPIGVSSLVGS